MVQKGLMSFALVAFYQNVLTKAPTTFLDKFCKEISTIMSCQSDCDYPRTSFPHLLLMLSQLRASKYPGVLLVLVMSLYLHACWSPNMPVWETPQTLMQIPSRSFIIYLYYFALMPGTGWMQL